ncbi:MAG TPA: CapA family protein [Candidatus Limnocylindria bacterium]|nr:CapA family protein [Candidatus Limnocylindria bacterium]
MAKDGYVTLAAVGDITAFHKDPESGYELVGPVMREMDVVFAQNERHYTKRRDIFPIGGFTERTDPENAKALRLGNYHVLSFASNHLLDLGPEVLLETIGVLRDLGFAVIGAGANIAEARRPAFVERRGTTIGFLAYCSVLRPNYEAGPTSPGAAPMRAYTHYQQVDYKPGTRPQILTFPYKDDLAALLADVRAAKVRADVLAVSMHWGLNGTDELAMYQRDVAYAAIDAGADVILGHSPHRLKAIEVYRGRPIFYSMGNFCFDQPRWALDQGRAQSPEHAAHMDRQGWTYDPEYEEWYAVPPENRKSMLVKIQIAGKKIARASFLPVLINKRAQPEILSHGDARFDDVVAYVRRVTEGQGIHTPYSVEGDEVVVPLA